MRRAIEGICEDAGLGSNEYDASAVTGECGGYAIRGPQPTKTSLQPLLLAGNIVARDDGGVLVFESRDAMTATDIDADESELGVYDGSANPDAPVRIVDQADADLPSEIVVKYIDPENDYTTGSRTAKLATPINASTQTIDLPVALSADEAQELANRTLAVAHATRFAFSGTFLPRFLTTAKEGTLVNLKNVHGRDWTVLLSRVERGANLLPAFEGILEDPEAYDQEID
jgi:hypothetical protein